jgi:hypothetical protein
MYRPFLLGIVIMDNKEVLRALIVEGCPEHVVRAMTTKGIDLAKLLAIWRLLQENLPMLIAFVQELIAILGSAPRQVEPKDSFEAKTVTKKKRR